MTHNVAWQVSLSNGETVSEGVGRFSETEIEMSPWQKLLVYLSENNLQITSLVLVNVYRTFNLPSAGKNPKFRRFDMAGKPTGYRCERTIGKDVSVTGEALGGSDWFTIGVAEYPDYELQIWVDENKPENCWTLVVPKEHNK